MQPDEGILHLGSRNLSEYTFACDTSHPDCCFLIIGLGSMRMYSLINVAKCLMILSMGLPAPLPNINLIRESKRQSKCELFSYTFLQHLVLTAQMTSTHCVPHIACLQQLLLEAQPRILRYMLPRTTCFGSA